MEGACEVRLWKAPSPPSCLLLSSTKTPLPEPGAFVPTLSHTLALSRSVLSLSAAHSLSLYPSICLSAYLSLSSHHPAIVPPRLTSYKTHTTYTRTQHTYARTHKHTHTHTNYAHKSHPFSLAAGCCALLPTARAAPNQILRATKHKTHIPHLPSPTALNHRNLSFLHDHDERRLRTSDDGYE